MSSFPLDAAVGAQVVDILRGLGPDVTILTRLRPRFDQFVQTACIILQIRCLTFDAEGGLSNLERDSALVNEATEMHVFLDLDSHADGRLSGSAWLMEKAQSAGIPTYAYGLADGLLVMVGATETSPA